MSGAPPPPGDPPGGPGDDGDDARDLLAAEYALRLLEGEELLHARGLAGTDAGFRAAVEAWERRLAPLAETVAEVDPGPEVWARIERAVAAETAAGTGAQAGADEPARDNVVALKRRERLWRGLAGTMAALAAGLALALYLAVAQPDPTGAPPTAGAPAPSLVAALAADDGTAALAIAYEAERGSVLVTPTLLQPAAGHDHELWLIAGEGAAPVSLGLVRTTAPQRLAVPAAARGGIRPAATLALSVEPTGGSPTGAPTGPVIASGPLQPL